MLLVKPPCFVFVFSQDSIANPLGAYGMLPLKTLKNSDGGPTNHPIELRKIIWTKPHNFQVRKAQMLRLYYAVLYLYMNENHIFFSRPNVAKYTSPIKHLGCWSSRELNLFFPTRWTGRVSSGQDSNVQAGLGAVWGVGWLCTTFLEPIWMFPKIVGFFPKSSHSKIGVSMIFTIHFRGVPPIFWKHPYN